MANRSRLSKRLEKQTRKNLIISILGIFFILFLLIKFGLFLLVNFTLFLSNFRGDKETSVVTKSVSDFVSIPIINPLPTATNSAQITISGTASKKQTINLYINDELVKKIKITDETFTFENVKLSKGENDIKVKAITQDNKESQLSKSVVVIFKDKAPALAVDSPNPDQSFSKDENNIKVSGKTDKGARVTVNDFWAIVDENGNFSYQLLLKNGDNPIKIVTTDEAGNKTEMERKVIYSQ